MAKRKKSPTKLTDLKKVEKETTPDKDAPMYEIPLAFQRILNDPHGYIDSLDKDPVKWLLGGTDEN